MTLFEITLMLGARGIIGILIATAFASIIWAIGWLVFASVPKDTSWFFLSQALVVAIPAGFGAAGAWWNPESPGRLRLLQVASIVVLACIAAWLNIEISGVDTYNALFFGAFRAPTLILGDMLGTLIGTAVITANVVGAAFMIHQVVVRREF